MRLSFLTLLGLLAKETHAKGIQSGPNAGPMYSSSLAYDKNQRSVYVTGITYDPEFDAQVGIQASPLPSCFIGNIAQGGDEYETLDGKVLGDNAFQTCTTSALVNSQSAIVVMGTSKSKDFYSMAETDLASFGLALDKNALTEIDGRTLSTDPIRYPVASVANGNDVYIVAYTATDGEQSTSLPSKSTPNWLLYQEFGTSLEMSVMKMSLTQEEFNGIPEGDIQFSSGWVANFPIDAEDDGTIPRVFLGGMILKGEDSLIIAGSTRGLGDGYGRAEGDDEDGFITIVSTSDGQLKPSSKDNERIGTAKDDVVTGICDDPNDSQAFYIVGATKGVLSEATAAGDKDVVENSLQAFIMKMDLTNLHAKWTTSFGAINDAGSLTSVYALGCAVNEDGMVYVGGTVESGASMVHGDSVKKSNGKDDVWVAQMHASSGQITWMQQIGTSEKDNMARHSGLITDENGNAVLLGDTYGSLFRDRGQTEPTDNSDFFLVTLGKDDGSYDGGAPAPVAPPVAPVASTPAPVAPTNPPVAAPVTPPHQIPAFHGLGVQLAGPLYAGGMVYNPEKAQLVLTGGAYVDLMDSTSFSKSQCFISTMDLASGKITSSSHFGPANTEGEQTNVPASCSAVSYSPQNDRAYAIGSSEVNGPFWNYVSETNAVQYGLLFELSQVKNQVIGGGVNDDDTVQYPIAVTQNPSDKEHVYALFMASDQDAVQNDEIDSAQYPDLTSGGRRSKYGNDFFMVVKRYRVDTPDEQVQNPPPHSVHTDWYQYFDTNADGDIYPSGMTMAGDGSIIVVVGSTSTTGGIFGEKGTDDMDGFIAKIDAETGKLLEGSGKSSTRVDSSNHKDDYVTGICADPYDQDAVYLVGKTMGKIRALSDVEQLPDGSTHAFACRIHLKALSVEWSKHFTMTSDDPHERAEAYACKVHSSGDGTSKVYVTGVVEDGAKMDDSVEDKSFGEDDIFVAQLNGQTGDLNWMRQIGTTTDDNLATGGPMDLDADGNAIIFAQTNGNFYGPASNKDLVVFTVSAVDGEYLPLGAGNGGAIVKPPPHVALPNDDDDVLPGGGIISEQPENPISDDIVAYQSGPDVGPTYAGGMVYDAFTNGIYVTGSTYGSFSGPGIAAKKKSSCFFGIMALPKLIWQERETYGEENAHEACNALSLTSYEGKSAAIVVGSTEKDGLMTQLGSGAQDKQYGMVLDLESVNGGFELAGGALIDDSKVQFPIAVVAAASDVWTVSMASQNTRVTADYETVKNNFYPNWTTGGVEKFGSRYSIVLEKRNMNRAGAASGVIQETLKRDWRKPFETADLESVYVSGLIINGVRSAGKLAGVNELIGVGSTKSHTGGKSGDMDGILFKVDPDTGSFAEGKNSRSVAYFSSSEAKDDWLLNVCEDPNEPLHFYVVGATKGSLDSTIDRAQGDETTHAIVSKIQVRDLTPLWTRQFQVSHNDGSKKPAAAVALGCDVIKGEKLMYFAGNVENGAKLAFEGRYVSAGGDDIFVGQLSTDNGDVKWLKQIGSAGDDRVARGGGVKADSNGNAVVFGDSNGSLFRDRDQAEYKHQFSDVFAMVLNKENGRSQDPVVPTYKFKNNNVSAPKEWYGNLSEKQKSGAKIFGIIVLVIAILGLLYFCWRRFSSGKEGKDFFFMLWFSSTCQLTYTFTFLLFQPIRKKWTFSTPNRGSQIRYQVRLPLEDPEGMLCSVMIHI